MSIAEIIVTIICSVLASSGLWGYLQQKHEKKDVKVQMLIGLGHDRVMELGKSYILRYQESGQGMTADEYENLYEYLYKPYEAMGGNGSARRIMDEVKKIPIVG